MGDCILDRKLDNTAKSNIINHDMSINQIVRIAVVSLRASGDLNFPEISRNYLKLVNSEMKIAKIIGYSL
jgi:hypothetical protein